jgi:hypothetical protein
MYYNHLETSRTIRVIGQLRRTQLPQPSSDGNGPLQPRVTPVSV